LAPVFLHHYLIGVGLIAESTMHKKIGLDCTGSILLFECASQARSQNCTYLQQPHLPVLLQEAENL
jgi:hypothetical protein